MNRNEDIRKIGFGQIYDSNEVNYSYNDNGIAFHENIMELPVENGAIRLGMFIILTCTAGKLQFELNMTKYTLQQNEILICRPNDIIENSMLSPDFDGGILFLSRKGILEQISENDLWNRAFFISKNPIVKIDEENLHLFNLYYKTLKTRIRMNNTPYYKEIVVSIVKAILYELLAKVDKCEIPLFGSGLVKQRDVLFKRFIELLSSNNIKPRNVAWYADRLCVTPKYLSTVCKQVSDKTAFGWINDYVLGDIRRLLKNSNKSIKEISDTLQFPNLSFFGKYCRAHFGMSPTELRKQLRGQPDENR